MAETQSMIIVWSFLVLFQRSVKNLDRPTELAVLIGQVVPRARALHVLVFLALHISTRISLTADAWNASMASFAAMQ